MKTLSYLLLFIFPMSAVWAQQKPYFTQYIMNNYILNPAVTGIENYTDVKISYRNQWNDITGAPVTMYASIQGPIGRNEYRTTATSFETPGENPRGKAYWQEYKAAAPHGGLGMIVMNDRTGYINRSSAYGTVAFHLGLSPKTSLSAGFMAGGSKISIDRTKIEWGTLDPNDPAIGYNEQLQKFKPELAAGLWLYGSNFFLGASVLNIVSGKVRFSSSDEYGGYLEPQYLATAGVRFFVSDDVSALPSAMIQYIRPYPIQVHYNLKMQYQDKMWAGLSYRSSDQLGGFAAMAGFHLTSAFNFSYAYDMSGSARLRSNTGSTHEFILGFLLNNKYGDNCPRNVW